MSDADTCPECEFWVMEPVEGGNWTLVTEPTPPYRDARYRDLSQAKQTQQALKDDYARAGRGMVQFPQPLVFKVRPSTTGPNTVLELASW